MQKFSDVSSLSANELRTLFESELLTLHSKISNQVDKNQAQVASQQEFNQKTADDITSLKEKTKSYDSSISDMGSIISSNSISTS